MPRHTLARLRGLHLPMPDDEATEPATDGADAGGGAVPTPGDMPGATTPEVDNEQPDDDGDDWQAKYQAIKGEARKWESRAKANKQAQDQLAAIVKALNPEADDTSKPDPQALAQQLTAAQQAQQAAATELAVYRAAAQAGADPQALTDSRSFMDAVNKLDPTADDYTSQVQAAIKDALAKRPTLAAPQRAARSSGEHKQTPTQGAPTSLADAISRHYQ